MVEKNLTDIFFTSIVKRNIILEPRLHNKNVQENILKILQKEVENKCIEEGYIKAGTIVISKRTLPKLTPNTFGGTLRTEVRFKAEICNPVKGNIIECTVEKINKMGVMALEGPLNIIVPRSFHNNKDIFKDIEIGQKIRVQVIGSRYEINWDHIDIIGKLYLPQENKKKVEIINTPGPKNDVLDTISDNEFEEELDDMDDGIDDDMEDMMGGGSFDDIINNDENDEDDLINDDLNDDDDGDDGDDVELDDIDDDQEDKDDLVIEDDDTIILDDVSDNDDDDDYGDDDIE